MFPSPDIRDGVLAVLRRQTLPTGHLEVWEWLQGQVQWYPRDRKYWPWRRAKRPDRWRPIAMVGVTPTVRKDRTTPHVAQVSLHRPPHTTTIDVPDGPDGALAVARLLFADRTRRTSLVVPDGSRWVFDAFLASCVTHWVDAGFTVAPLVAGHVVKGIIVRSGRNRWTLSDFEAMTGSDPETALAEAEAPAVATTTTGGDLARLTAWVSRLQEISLRHFLAYLRPTVAGTTVRAAGFDIPEEELIPRNPPHLVAMCRAGLGYRGGYVYGEKYRGPAWKTDVRRLYADALRSPVGVRWAFGPAVPAKISALEGTPVLATNPETGPNGRPTVRPGVYLCDVSGDAVHPVTLGIWSGPSAGFVSTLHSQGDVIAVVPTSEIPGLEALGLTVTPSWGWVATHTVTFAPFVDRMGDVLAEYGSTSAAGRWAKVLGNALYGRMATNPDREIVVWAKTRPAGAVFPLITAQGDEVSDLWAVREVRYSPHQQIAAAAMVTGHARSVLYREMARQICRGARIVHAHTDGFVAVGPVPDDMPEHTDIIGAWRLVSVDDDAIVARAGGYAIGAETKWSGAPSQGRRTIELAWNRGDWIVRGLRTRRG